MISNNKLIVYCPLNKALCKIALKNNFHKFVITFQENKFYYKWTDRIIKYLEKSPNWRIIMEGLRFWYLFLMARHTYYVSDGNYYPRLMQFFIQRGVFAEQPRRFKPRGYNKYIVICYRNNKIWFVEKYATVNEIEIYFNLKIKTGKYKYTLNYKEEDG